MLLTFPKIRDPRVDPIAGDFLSNGKAIFRVVKVENNEVHFIAGDHMVTSVSISLWRKRAVNDTVVFQENRFEFYTQ